MSTRDDVPSDIIGLVKTAPVWYAMTRILQPWLRGLTGLSGLVQKIFSSRPPEPLVTTDELRQALDDSKNDTLGPSTSGTMTRDLPSPEK